MFWRLSFLPSELTVYFYLLILSLFSCCLLCDCVHVLRVFYAITKKRCHYGNGGSSASWQVSHLKRWQLFKFVYTPKQQLLKNLTELFPCQTLWWDQDAHRGKPEGWVPDFGSLSFWSFSFLSPHSSFPKLGAWLSSQWAFRLWDLRVKDCWEDQFVWITVQHKNVSKCIFVGH